MNSQEPAWTSEQPVESPLESWKEIAAYVQRDATTVRRWEKKEGLPVHRHSHQRGSSVYAYPSEIDAWRAGRKVAPEPAPVRVFWRWPALAATILLCLVMVGNGVRPVAAQQAGKGTSFHEVWKLPLKGTLPGTVSGPVSRDGRYLPFVDWSRNGNLFLHDLTTGAERALTTTATDRLPGNHIEQFAEETSFSRDARQIAYSWYRGDTNRYELRLMDLRGAGIPESRLVLDLPDNQGITPGDWSPDEKSIAVVILRSDKTGQIGIVSVPDGSLRVLKSLDWRGTTALAFSPDGKYLAYDLPEADNTEKRDLFVIAVDGSREISIAAGPSEDTLVGWSNDGKHLLFASDRSGSRRLWRIAFSDGRTEGAPEQLRADIGDVKIDGLTDTGKLYTEVNPPRGNNSVIGDIYLASIDFATGKVLSPPALAVPTFVGSNTTPAWSRDGKYLAYGSLRGAAGSRHFVFAIRPADGGESREISPSPGIERVDQLLWAPDGGSLILAGADVKGRYGILRVDVRTGQSSLLVPKGERQYPLTLSGVSPDGKRLYYSAGTFDDSLPDGRRRVVGIERDLATGTEKQIHEGNPLGALSPDGRYVRFLGVERPNPRAHVLPTGGGDARGLISSAEFGQIPPTTGWMADSSAVFFLTRDAMWVVPVAGGAPRKMDFKWDPSYPGIRFLAVNPDNRRIAFEAVPGKTPTEVWVLENFLPAANGK